MQTQIIDQPIEKWHDSIATLPLNKFIDVAVDRNFSSLIISGYPSMDKLADAWGNIQNEYADAIGEAEAGLYLSLMKETEILKIDYDMIGNLVKILQQVWYAPLCDMLNEVLRASYVFNPDHQDQYQKDLKSCLARSQSIKIRIHLNTARLEAIKEKNETKGQPYSRQYFQSVLITISDHAKYPILESVTVYEFCERVRRLNEYYKTLEKNKYHA